MAFRKIINDSEGGQKYVTEQEEELVFDQVPTKGSFNPVTSDGVAKGIEESSEQTKTDIKKVFQEGTSEQNKLVNEQNLYKELHRVPNGCTLRAGAKVGDILWVDPNNGDKYFFDKAVYPVSQAVADGLESVGVVADVDGRKLLILHKDESADLQFANCWLFKVIGINLNGTTNTINMQQHASNDSAVPAGTFTDSTSTTLAEFCTALDTWLREHQTVEGASETNWHCELMPDADGVDSCFIVVDTNSYQNRLSPIASGSTATAALYMWQFVGQTTDRITLLRNNGSNVYYAGWNKERLIGWFSNPANASISPTNDPNGEGLLNLSDFNGTSYPAVKEYYGDYETYMEAMMMKWPSETGSQSAIAGTGHDIGLVLGTHTHKNLSGETVYTFTANRYAYTRATEATRKSDALGDGGWYLPDVVDSFKVFSKMKVDGTDAINDSLSAISSRRSLSVTRWCCSRYGNGTSWLMGDRGNFANYAFTRSNRSCAVALLDSLIPEDTSVENPLVNKAELDKAAGSVQDKGAVTDGATVEVTNNAVQTLSTSRSTITVNVTPEDGQSPNFALEIAPSQDITITVTKTVGNTVTNLYPSNAGGNVADAGGYYQLTCVGNCWTLAPFTVPVTP